jgi:hypothetical protein
MKKYSCPPSLFKNKQINNKKLANNKRETKSERRKKTHTPTPFKISFFKRK